MLALDEPARSDRGLGMPCGDAPQPRLGDDGVLVLAEDVLQRLRCTDVRLEPGELRRVARPLHLDPYRVEVVVAGRLAEPRHGFLQGRVLGAPDGCQRQVGARIGKGRVGRRLEAVEQREVPRAAERAHQPTARRRALTAERAEDRLPTVPVLPETGGFDTETRREDVEVAHRAEDTAEPAELRPQIVRPGRVEQPAGRTEERPRPTRRDAQLMEALRVDAEPRSRIVREEAAVLRAERAGDPLGGRAVGRRVVEVWSVGEVERPEELRPRFAVARPCTAKRLLEAPQRPLVAFDQLHLELVEGPGHLPAVEHRDDVVHDLGAVDAKPVAACAEARDRHESGPANESGQQRDEVRRNRAGRAGLLELPPGVPARQLQLPHAPPVLDAVAERQSAAREPELGRVVVRGDEHARDQGLPAELRHGEALAGGQLHLSLERLAHPGHAVRRPRRCAARQDARSVPTVSR